MKKIATFTGAAAVLVLLYAFFTGRLDITDVSVTATQTVESSSSAAASSVVPTESVSAASSETVLTEPVTARQ